MRVLEKNKFLLFPLITGIMLIAYSWFLSYPLSIDSVTDSVFNHVSILLLGWPTVSVNVNVPDGYHVQK